MRKRIGTVLIIASLLFVLLKIRFYRIISGSMRPAISQGDVAVVFRTKKLKKGDIGAYSYPRNTKITIVHRVWMIRGKQYYFKGDANNIIDYQAVSEDSVIGKVILVIPLSKLT